MANRKSQRRTPATAQTKVTLTPVTATQQPKYDRNFNPDYTQVITDLKRIGTLASIFLAVLIVLSFFL